MSINKTDKLAEIRTYLDKAKIWNQTDTEILPESDELDDIFGLVNLTLLVPTTTIVNTLYNRFGIVPYYVREYILSDDFIVDYIIRKV